MSVPLDGKRQPVSCDATNVQPDTSSIANRELEDDEDEGASNGRCAAASLILGIVALARRFDIDTLFLLTEPRLATHFAKLGLKVRPVGAPIEHRGTRVPAMLNVREIVSGLKFFVRPLFKEIVREIDTAFPKQRTLH